MIDEQDAVRDILDSELYTLAALIQPSHLTNWYRFDEENPTVGIDYGNSGYNLVGTSLTSASFVEGIVGSAVDLDGVNDYFTRSPINMANLQDDTVGAVAFWAYIDENDGNTNMAFAVSRDADAILTELGIAFEAGANDNFVITLIIENVNQWEVRTASDSLDQYIGRWVHVCLVQDGASPVLYINAIPQTLTFAVSVDTTQWFSGLFGTAGGQDADSFSIGRVRRNSDGTTLPFDGKINELIIWDTPLISDEVKRLYLSYISEPVKKALIIHKTQITKSVEQTVTLNFPDAAGDLLDAFNGADVAAEPADLIERTPAFFDTSWDKNAMCKVHYEVDLNEMAGGDTVVFTIYKKIDGTNYRLFAEHSYTGVQAIDAITFEFKGTTTMGLKMGAKQTAGVARDVEVRFWGEGMNQRT